MNPRKKKRIEEMLRRELSSILLHEVRDPRAGFITLTRVELSEDQRSAKVYLTVRGTEEERDQTLQTLRRAHGYIQSLIGRRLSLRYTPVLRFREDKEVLNAMRLEKLIDKARREDREFRDVP
ncbi:MAG: 30S ribosome-binding factor RbfA [Candidatus Brocadiae bacterium]|nr:30S ribosome-binding factor RbfA [Candidatus Brocadiia bacterium]